jgi:hypothetical protein
MQKNRLIYLAAQMHGPTSYRGHRSCRRVARSDIGDLILTKLENIAGFSDEFSIAILIRRKRKTSEAHEVV